MIIIVGAGLTGLTIAERLNRLNFKDLVMFEERDIIGGNCADKYDSEIKTYVHLYGPHLFHTNNKEIWDYIRKFGEFIEIKHKIAIKTYSGYFYLPLNLKNIDDFYGKKISNYLLKKYGINKLVSLNELTNDKKTFKLGIKIYEEVYRKYSEKQWGNYFEELKPIIFNRVSAFHTFNNKNYFQDKYQGLPKYGYCNIFKNMAKGIKIYNNKFTFYDYFKKYKRDMIIYTGSIDTFFNNILGDLDYIGLKFDRINSEEYNFKILNLPLHPIYTRYVDYAKLYNLKIKNKVKICEVPKLNKYIKCYPVLTKKNIDLYSIYLDFAKCYFPNIIFCGRLGDYKYYNMDQAIKRAFEVVEEISRNYSEIKFLNK